MTTIDWRAKMDMPLDSLTRWIVHEMLHNNILLSEVKRATYQDPEDIAALLTDTQLINPSAQLDEPGNNNNGLTEWNLERDAMFRIVPGQDGKYHHLSPEFQPVFPQYKPVPGGKGSGPPPSYNFKTAVEYLQPAVFRNSTPGLLTDLSWPQRTTTSTTEDAAPTTGSKQSPTPDQRCSTTRIRCKESPTSPSEQR